MNKVAHHRDLVRWWNIGIEDAGGNLSVLKAAFDIRNLGRRAWRLYLDYGDVLFEPLKPDWLSDDKPFSTPERATRYLGLLQALESDIPPQAELVRSLSDWNVPGHRLELIPPRFFKAAWKRYTFAELQGNAEHALSTEITPLARWFLNEASEQHSNDNLLKSGWSSLLRACEEAHEDGEEQVSVDTHWFPVLLKVEIGPYRIVAILNQRELVEEGNVMNHCIASYGQWFATELARPFSIRSRSTDARLATMVVHEVKPGCWSIDQLSGYDNQEVSSSIHEAAFSVIRALEDVVALDPELGLLLEDARKSQPPETQWSMNIGQ